MIPATTTAPTQMSIFFLKGGFGAGVAWEGGVETGSGSEITAAWYYNRLRAKSATCSPSGNKAVAHWAGRHWALVWSFYNIRFEAGVRASQSTSDVQRYAAERHWVDGALLDVGPSLRPPATQRNESRGVTLSVGR